MIDIRNISYTQGTPLSPVVDGTLLQTAPTLNLPAGTLVSRVDNNKDRNGDKKGFVDFLGNLDIWEAWQIWGNLGQGDIQSGLESIYYSQAKTQEEIQRLQELFRSEAWKEEMKAADVPTGANVTDIIPNINIEFPDVLGALKGAGKWLLIGGAAIIAIWGASKFYGKRK